MLQEILSRAQEKQAEVNVAILQSLSYFQKHKNWGSIMDRGRRLMGHMVEGLDQDISWTKMIELEVENGWTHLTGEVVLMNFILPLVLRDIIVIVAIIIIGVRIGIFQRSSRKSSLLLFMER